MINKRTPRRRKKNTRKPNLPVFLRIFRTKLPRRRGLGASNIMVLNFLNCPR